jgi:RNA polymerase sigma-70 factor (ECF subfamily)
MNCSLPEIAALEIVQPPQAQVCAAAGAYLCPAGCVFQSESIPGSRRGVQVMSEANILQLAVAGAAGRLQGQSRIRTVAVSSVESSPAMGNRTISDRISGVKKTAQQNEERAQQRVEDAEFIRQAQKGSREAFDALVRRYDQPVLRLALHMLGSEQDAQDVHQEAFIKAYRHLNNFRFECSFYTWMYRIVTNLCLDQLRRRKSRREDSATVIDSSGEEHDLMSNLADGRSMANPARELERKHLGASIAAALDTLTPRERMVFELKHYQGLRLRTIGEMLSTTEETAKNTLFRATRKLRAKLATERM